MDLFLLFKFSIPVRSKGSEKRGQGEKGADLFFYEKVYFNGGFVLEDISEGKLPCQVFRDLIKVDPTIGNVRLGEVFHEEFIEVDSLALQLIWHWRGPGKTEGISDESLNAELLVMLKNAGYLKR